jgi:hypothetical protein
METVIISTNNKSDMRLLVGLAKKIGAFTKKLTSEEVEDWQLAEKIEEGLKTGDVSKNAVMKYKHS